MSSPKSTSHPEPSTATELPPVSLRAVLSLLLIVHFSLLFLFSLDSASGPWVTRMGPDFAHSPTFADILSTKIATPYLAAIKLNHHFEFSTIRPEPTTDAIVTLYDDQDQRIEEWRLPDPRARSAIRYRQLLMVNNLLAADSIPMPEGERIPAPGQAPPSLEYWRLDPVQGKATLTTQFEHRLRTEVRGDSIMIPTPWSIVVARAFGRQVQRATGAARVTIEGGRRDPLPLPHVLPAEIRLNEEDFKRIAYEFGNPASWQPRSSLNAR